MSRVRYVVLALTAALAIPASAHADPIVDFSTLSGGTITSLGPSESLSGILASAYYLDGTWQTSELIARNETNDNGLGVCSESSGCNIGGTGAGDYNELSQLSYTEAILLEKPDDALWTGVWLSSLDGNDGSTALGPENGTLYWGSTSDIALLISTGGAFNFTYPAFGTAVEGALTLPGTFDATAKYLLFVPGGSVGANNDYLVWGVDIETPVGDQPVPEPASLLLLGTGLVAVARVRRRVGR